MFKKLTVIIKFLTHKKLSVLIITYYNYIIIMFVKAVKCFLGYTRRLRRIKLLNSPACNIVYKCHRANLNCQESQNESLIVSYNSRPCEYLLAQDNAIFPASARRLQTVHPSSLPPRASSARFDGFEHRHIITRSLVLYPILRE